MFATPGDTTRPPRRIEPARSDTRAEPVGLGEPNKTDQAEPTDSQNPIPRADTVETERFEVSNDEEPKENVWWAEEFAGEQEIKAIKLSLAKAETEMKLVKS